MYVHFYPFKSCSHKLIARRGDKSIYGWTRILKEIYLTALWITLSKSRLFNVCSMNITPVLTVLYWLPAYFRVDFKFLLLVFKVLNGLLPPFLSELLYIHTPVRALRSSNQCFCMLPEQDWEIEAACALEWLLTSSSIKKKKIEIWIQNLFDAPK